MKSTEQKPDVFTMITNVIVGHLKNGIIPWEQPWTAAGLPRNLFTDQPFHGINVWLLASLNYECNLFLALHEIERLGGFIKTGQKGHIVLAETSAPENGEAPRKCSKAKASPKLYCSKVWNVSQCALPENIFPVDAPAINRNRIAVCKEVLETMPDIPSIRNRGDSAFYHPFFDFINMPAPYRFSNEETYYATLFHYLVVSTAQEKRLNRKEGQMLVPNDFDLYSLEQLTAEMGASYLISLTGIESYNYATQFREIAKWIEVLQEDPTLVVTAATQAQSAVDYMLGSKHRMSRSMEFELEVLVDEETGQRVSAIHKILRA